MPSTNDDPIMPSDKSISITHRDMQQAVDTGIVTQQQADALWQHWLPLHGTVRDTDDAALRQSRRFSGVNVTYYAGGILLILAGSFFFSLAWSAFGTAAMGLVSLLIAVVFAGLGWRSYRHHHHLTIGGLLSVASVCMVPLVVYCLYDVMGWWPDDAKIDKAID